MNHIQILYDTDYDIYRKVMKCVLFKRVNTEFIEKYMSKVIKRDPNYGFEYLFSQKGLLNNISSKWKYFNKHTEQQFRQNTLFEAYIRLAYQRNIFIGSNRITEEVKEIKEIEETKEYNNQLNYIKFLLFNGAFKHSWFYKPGWKSYLIYYNRTPPYFDDKRYIIMKKSEVLELFSKVNKF